MAGAEKDQKKYDPSAKRLSDAREKGNLPSAPEVKHAAAFIGALLVTGGLGVQAFATLGAMMVRLWGRADDFSLAPAGAQSLATGLFTRFAFALAPLLGVFVVLAILTGFAAGVPTISWSRVAPKWSKVSPLSGFKRMFGMQALVEFGKTLVKLSVVLGVCTWLLWPRAVALDTLIGADPADIGLAAGGLVSMLVKGVALPVAALAAFDLIYQRRQWWTKLKMTFQEVKDEHKDSEGDPKIKGKIRAMAMQRARRRMMSAVPEASVIITNPTHYAVALKYEHGKTSAPVVVAKGVDAVALKIREIATAAGVPIVENRPLARALHASAEIDRPIPIEHYAAVAEIIGYVMRLAKRRR